MLRDDIAWRGITSVRIIAAGAWEALYRFMRRNENSNLIFRHAGHTNKGGKLVSLRDGKCGFQHTRIAFRFKWALGEGRSPLGNVRWECLRNANLKVINQLRFRIIFSKWKMCEQCGVYACTHGIGVV